MDRDTQIEISRIADAVEQMATTYFADSRSDGTSFETNVSFGDDHPERARLICEGLRLSLCEIYKPSRVHVSLKDTNYFVQIDYA